MTAQIHRLASAFAGRLCDKYRDLMSSLKYALLLACNENTDHIYGTVNCCGLETFFGYVSACLYHLVNPDLMDCFLSYMSTIPDTIHA